MSQKTLFTDPDVRAWHIHMARVFIAQARATQHRAWKFTLLQWAADRRKRASA